MQCGVDSACQRNVSVTSTVKQAGDAAIAPVNAETLVLQ